MFTEDSFKRFHNLTINILNQKYIILNDLHKIKPKLGIENYVLKAILSSIQVVKEIYNNNPIFTEMYISIATKELSHWPGRIKELLELAKVPPSEEDLDEQLCQEEWARCQMRVNELLSD